MLNKDEDLFDEIEKQLNLFTKNITYILKRYEENIIVIGVSDINNYKATEMISDIDLKTIKEVANKISNRIGDYTYKNVGYRG